MKTTTADPLNTTVTVSMHLKHTLGRKLKKHLSKACQNFKETSHVLIDIIDEFLHCEHLVAC